VLHYAPLVLSNVTTPFSELPLSLNSHTIVLMLSPLTLNVTIPPTALLGPQTAVGHLVGGASRKRNLRMCGEGRPSISFLNPTATLSMFRFFPRERTRRVPQVATVAVRRVAPNGSEQIDLPLPQPRSGPAVETLWRTAALSELPALWSTRTVLSMTTQTLCT
jgi:hypothetical protein